MPMLVYELYRFPIAFESVGCKVHPEEMVVQGEAACVLEAAGGLSCIERPSPLLLT